MFEGVADQFNQFIASRTSLPLPLSFSPLHDSSNNTAAFPSFDPYVTNHQVVPLQQPCSFLQPLHQCPTTSKNEGKEENSLVAADFPMGGDRLIPEPVDQWSNDEVLALLRIRSSMENWFLDYFSWEHVSRKLAEMGFQRSARNCKEKFEEESRFFDTNINRPFSELEEFYHGDQNSQDAAAEESKKLDKPSEEEDKIGDDSRTVETVAANPTGDKAKKSNRKKREREKEKFEMFKTFCEGIVNKLMAQQEEIHNKLIEDMMTRNVEKVAREEAWKKQETDKIKKELELRAHEQALASERQATIIKFLKQFTQSSGSSIEILGERSGQDIVETMTNSTSSSSILAQNPKGTSKSNDPSQLEAPTSSTINLGHQYFSSLPGKNKLVMPTPISLIESQAPQNPSPVPAPSIPKSPIPSELEALQDPNSLNFQTTPLASNSLPRDTVHPRFPSNDKEELGRRWPRDEVVALIELKCSLSNSNIEDKEGASKAPLWERISQGMLELGYKRSSKRCKEKWENINKYFRKTKDAKRKRSIESRTCPYFHQLSILYNQGMLTTPSEEPRNRSASPVSHSSLPKTGLTSSQHGWPSVGNTTMCVREGEKNVV